MFARLPFTGAKALILSGGPGCGKGTQGKLLSDDRLEMGPFFRDIDNGTATDAFSSFIASRVDLKRMRAGFYLPDAPVNEVYRHLLGKLDTRSQLIVLDGVGRTVPQVHYTCDLLEEYGIMPEDIGCVYFDVDMEECRRRLLARAAISGRADDGSANVVNTRVNTFLHHEPFVKNALQQRCSFMELRVRTASTHRQLTAEQVQASIAEVYEQMRLALLGRMEIEIPEHAVRMEPVASSR